MFFKEPLTEWFFVEPKMIILWHLCEPRIHTLLATVNIHSFESLGSVGLLFIILN